MRSVRGLGVDRRLLAHYKTCRQQDFGQNFVWLQFSEVDLKVALVKTNVNHCSRIWAAFLPVILPLAE